jgi:hypothetical protein
MSELEDAEKAAFQTKTAELERLSDNTIRAAEGRRDLPIPEGEYLKKISELFGDCEDAIKDHLASPLTASELDLVVTAFNAVHESIDSLIVFKALEGTVFNTETVAND